MHESQELQEIRKLEGSFSEFQKEMRNDMKEVWVAIGQRVTWVWLWTILVFLLGVLGALTSALYFKIESMNDKLSVMGNDVASVNTIVKGLDFEIKK
jgi:uncharacterized protein involved in exopolysaccharide biosynthesis